jgi:plastocyanin
MHRLRLSLVIALLALALSASATVHTVTVSNFQFSPSTVTITFGDTIIWTNQSGTHNVNHTGNPRLFRSGNPVSGNWTYQYPNPTETTPLPAGSYAYNCQQHPSSMNGTVVVEQSDARQPDRAAVPASPVLTQNFPNPFNSSTEIEFALPQAAHVKLSIFNVLGQNLRTLVDSDLSAGSHRLNFDASGLATGLYFYVLETPGATLTRKMQFLK